MPGALPMSFVDTPNGTLKRPLCRAAHVCVYCPPQDRSGSLAQGEVKAALQHAGFALDDAVVGVMVQRHDPDHSGTMNLPEFIKL